MFVPDRVVTLPDVKPFIMVSTRPEIEAAEQEYESFRVQGGLEPADLQHVRLEEVDFLSGFKAGDVSGVFIGGSPYDTSTPAASKTRTQLRVEEQVRELLAVALKESVPVLATGFGLEVLADYLGTAPTTRFAELIGSSEIFLTAEGREDPLLAGMPEAFTAFVGHHEGVGQVPAGATLLATSPDCPVQMLRVGSCVYGTQFNPELDVDRFLARLSIYRDAGYGDPGLIDDLLGEARTSGSSHEAGRLIRAFVEYFSQS